MRIKFKQITIIGVGLIGGSFARACRSKGIAEKIVGCGRGETNLIRGMRLGVIDAYFIDLKEAVADADIIFLAAPVEAIISIAKEIAYFLKPGAIVTDAGSVKGEIVRQIEKIFLPHEVCFVGAHPIAGAEKGGVEASYDSLFEGAKCVITPGDSADSMALEIVKSLWGKLGAVVIEMGADKHDLIMGGVSHLPHVVAYALVNAVSRISENSKGILEFSAGGFRDITRIASSSPRLWREICLMNREKLIPLIKEFKSTLEDIEHQINDQAAEELEERFRTAKEFRDKIAGRKKNLTIAIDGPAGSGKSAAAICLAERLGYIHIDTGAMYRAVAWNVLKKRIPLDDEERIGNLAEKIKIEFIQTEAGKRILVDAIDVTDFIRENRISDATSKISLFRKVRDAMTALQRRYCEIGGVVMDGRDIGTVVFPGAQVKFFLEASLEERAKRRFLELKKKAEDVDIKKIIEEISIRDSRDRSREIAPLTAASDAVLIDTTHLSIDELLDFMLKIVL